MIPTPTQPLPNPRGGRAEPVWIGAAVALFVGGCATVGMERAAPSITAATIDAGAARGFSAADIERGRGVFVAKCAECHTLQPPAGRSEEEWGTILPRMARRARLDEDDARSVRAYILAARLVGPGGAALK